MFEGAVNWTEDRAVRHVALRNRLNRPIRVDVVNVLSPANAVLRKLPTFSERRAVSAFVAAPAVRLQRAEHDSPVTRANCPYLWRGDRTVRSPRLRQGDGVADQLVRLTE
jgi:hypothetical protein